MKAARRDNNEREMIEAWRALGAYWIPQAPGAGFDGVLIHCGQVYFVEVKAPRTAGARYYLTASEGRAQYKILDAGGDYRIITNMAEALGLVGAA